MGYLDAQEGAHARTAFRTAEKLYKRYKNSKHRKKTIPPPSTDLSQVLDFRKHAEEVLKDRTVKVNGVSLATEAQDDRPVFVIDGHPGFYFVPQALSVEEQFYWIRESLTTFPQPPNRTNHNVVHGPISDLWSHVQQRHVLVEDTRNATDSTENNPKTQHESPVPRTEAVMNGSSDDCWAAGNPLEFNLVEEHADSNATDQTPCRNSGNNGAFSARVIHEKVEEGRVKWRFLDEAEVQNSSLGTESPKLITAESLLRKMRWATIGQQFDWTKKCYNTTLPYSSKLPQKLCELAARLAEPAMRGETFLAEGAIVNYYGPDDMLGGHIDDMEADWSKPIVSISLGCKAVFLLGGTSRDDVPVAMFLRSGDVVLMAGPARRCFHGVPRIFVDPTESELPDFSAIDQITAAPFLDYIKESRININVRQVH